MSFPHQRSPTGLAIHNPLLRCALLGLASVQIEGVAHAGKNANIPQDEGDFRTTLMRRQTIDPNAALVDSPDRPQRRPDRQTIDPNAALSIGHPQRDDQPKVRRNGFALNEARFATHAHTTYTQGIRSSGLVESSEFLISEIMDFWVMGVPGCVGGQRWAPCGGAPRSAGAPRNPQQVHELFIHILFTFFYAAAVYATPP